MHSRGNTWKKIAPEYGSVITNSATFVADRPVGRGFPKSTWASPGRMRQRQKDFLCDSASAPGPRP